MDFAFAEAQQQLRQEVRDFVRKEASPELIRETTYGQPGLAYREFLRKIGAKGWLCPTWPKEYGGIEGSHIDRLIIYEELCYQRALPLQFLVASVIAGPTIMLYGTEEQKGEYLLPIAKGEIEFALGYTEPEAGSDLARLDIRAVEDRDDFVLNGQKMFNTGCHYSDYHWLAVRTDPNVPRHRGISLMIVDLKSPGITIRPLWTMAGFRTNEVFYDDVRVPKKNLVGEKNKGWRYIATALDLERGFLFSVSQLLRSFEELVSYAKDTVRQGKALSQDPLIRQRLAEMAIELELARLFLYRGAWLLDRGQVPSYESCVVKTFVCELWQRLFETAMRVLRHYGSLKPDSRCAPLGGIIECYYQWSTIQTIVAGTSEIMRNLIAIRGLELPRE